jgi:hypothetical protein
MANHMPFYTEVLTLGSQFADLVEGFLHSILAEAPHSRRNRITNDAGCHRFGYGDEPHTSGITA